MNGEATSRLCYQKTPQMHNKFGKSSPQCACELVNVANWNCQDSDVMYRNVR